MKLMYKPDARDDLEDIPQPKRDKLIAKAKKQQAKPLSGELSGHFSVRLGEYRLVYRPAETYLVVVAVFHRSRGYHGIDV